MNTKMINTKTASKLAIEKIRELSVSELLTKIQENKDTTLAVAVRELSNFSHRRHYKSIDSSFYYAVEMTKMPAMNSSEYSLEEITGTGTPEVEYARAS